MAISDDKPTAAAAAAEAKEESDDECPDLEEANDAAADAGLMDAARRGKADKKSKKAMAKYGFKYFPGVTKITIRRAQRAQFVIKNPDVYRSNTNEQTFVFFGEAKAEDFSADAHKLLVEQITAAARAQALSAAPAAGAAAGAEAAGDDETVDATGVAEADIEVVRASARCTRAQAVKALKENNNELIKAIMSMTM